MKSKEIEIELFEEHDKVSFYTLRFKGDENEVDKFLDKFPEGCPYDDDIDIIIKYIDKIGETGALERYLRPERNVYAIPIETSNLRLYVIRVSDNILVIGNGDVKNTRTYNENPELTPHVELLQEIERYIRSRIKSKKLNLYGKKIFGDLTFTLK